MKLMEWFLVLVSGKPHFYIGGTERPYMLRWYLLPRNRWLNVYLHKFMRDDDDRALHDHPWRFVSIMLAGEYVEHLNAQYPYRWRYTERRAGSIAFRNAEHRHRVELRKRPDGSPIPCWTLVITSRKVRTWGFWCPKGFVPWHEFVSRDDHGAVGPGCGD